MMQTHDVAVSRGSNLVRRVLGLVVLVALASVLVVVERTTVATPGGAGQDRIPLSAFPQAPPMGRISTSWFCPGMSAGDGISSGSVLIANPTGTVVNAVVTVMYADDSQQIEVEVEPRARKIVDVLRGRTVGVVVPMVEIIGAEAYVEQQITFAAGDVTSPCAVGTSSTWFFADGFTREGSTERIIIANPFPESAVVDVRFTTAEGERKAPTLQGLIIAPRTARSISMSDNGANEEELLAVRVEANRGKVVASRAQHYLGNGRLGYSLSLGVPQALDKWWFAGGNAGPKVVEQLVLFNPGDSDITVDAVFVGEGLTVDPSLVQAGTGAPVVTASTQVGPGEVVTLDTGAAADLPRGVHGIVVSSPTGEPFVAEHVVNQRIKGRSFTAIVPGAPDRLASRVWRAPAGIAPGTLGALTIVNTTAEPGTVSITAIGPGGEFPVPGLTDLAISSGGLLMVDMPTTATDGQLTITATIPVIVQRRLSRGHGLVGYSAALALPSPRG